jgi:hypothetical protein
MALPVNMYSVVGVMEYWSTGVLEYWNVGVLEPLKMPNRKSQ